MAGTSHKVSRALFKEVFTGGRSTHSTTFTLKKIVKPNSLTLFSVVVSAKVAKKAVKRNLIKRRIRAALVELKSSIQPGSVIIVFTKPSIVSMSYTEIKKQLDTSLRSL